jgi:hypothetical protein
MHHDDPLARRFGRIRLALCGLVVACGGGADAEPQGESSSGAGGTTSTTTASTSGTPSGDGPGTTGGGTTGSTTVIDTSTEGTSTDSGEGTGADSTDEGASTSTGEPACVTPEPIVPDDLCAAEEQLQAYQPGMVVHGELGILDAVLLEAEPTPPSEGFNTWTVLVRDVATCTPQPGVALDVVPFMPGHGHGSPTTPIVTDHGDGTYGIEDLNLWMSGHWRVRIAMTNERLVDDDAAFHLCIE